MSFIMRNCYKNIQKTLFSSEWSYFFIFLDKCFLNAFQCNVSIKANHQIYLYITFRAQRQIKELYIEESFKRSDY